MPKQSSRPAQAPVCYQIPAQSLDTLHFHALKTHKDGTMQGDFWSLSPESIHQVTWLFGDPGNLPPGFGASPDKMLQARQVAHFTRADPAYGAGVA